MADVDQDQEINADMLPPEMQEQENDIFSQIHQSEIQRVKELRNQRRKLEGNDYIPFDESTSGGVYARDQIHAINNNKDNLEAHIIQRQLIKDYYQGNNQNNLIQQNKQKFQQANGQIFDIDHQDIYEDQIMSENESGEDKDEVEAFIKQRVKEGTGKDYEKIVKKDIVTYNKLKNQQDSEFVDINKYENSQAYKKVQTLMEQEIDDYLNSIDLEISNTNKQITFNQNQADDIKSQLKQSEDEIEDSDKRFEKVGQEFIQSKEAVDILEDLKDMLTEKQDHIDDLLKRKLSIEKNLYEDINREMVGHISDIFKDLCDDKAPFYLNKNFSQDLLENIIENIDEQQKRAILRISSDNIWQNIINKKRGSYISELKHIQYEAKKGVFDDSIDEKYQHLQDSFYIAINTLLKLDTQIKLEDLINFIVPYFQVEALQQDIEQIIPSSDFSKYRNFNQLHQFLDFNKDYFQLRERSYFIAKLLTNVFQKYFCSLIKYVWNPFDKEETVILVLLIKNYIDLIFIQDEKTEQTIFGIEQVKELLNSTLLRYQNCIELLEFSLKDILQNDIIVGIKSLIISIMEWSSQIPWVNIESLIVKDIIKEKVIKVFVKASKTNQQNAIDLLNKILNTEVRIFIRTISDNLQDINDQESEINKTNAILNKLKGDLNIEIDSLF